VVKFLPFHKSRSRSQRIQALFLVIYLIAGNFVCYLPAEARELNQFEEYVLASVKYGEIANLEKASSCKVSSTFLRELLTLSKEQTTSKGVHIQNVIFDDDDDPFSFPNIDVLYEVQFEHCEFRAGMNLSGSHFHKGLSFRHSIFKAATHFDDAQINGSFDLSGAIFEQAFEAGHAEIGGDLVGREARFQGPASFAEIKVTHSVDFMTLNTNQPTCFEKEVDWSGTVVNHKFLANSGRFNGAAKCDGLKVGGSIWMPNCQFAGETSFGYARIGDDFDASGSKFSCAATKANFYGLRCGSLKLDRAVFNGGADFGIAAIANDLSLFNTSFESQKEISFYATDIKGTAFLDKSRFLGPVNCLLAHVGGNFSAANVKFLNRANLNKLQKSDENDSQKLEPEEDGQSTFNADFGSLIVDGFTFFNRSTFAGDVSFRNARIQNLVLDGVKWPDPVPSRSLRMEGLTYQRIRSVTNKVFVLERADLEKSWDNLRHTLRRYAPYSFDVYQNLEAYFMREGQPELADAVFIEGKRREREDAGWTSKVWNCFLDWTVGYGRNPGRAIVISIFPLLSGMLLFNKLNMQPVDSRNKPEEIPYHPLWYSLDLFLPFIDLWVKGKWEPKPDKKGIWAYACTHKFLGWVLVPVGLAAFAGIVK